MSTVDKAKLITSERDLLLMLADPDLRLSHWEGKATVVRRDDEDKVSLARVQNGLVGRMVDVGLMVYGGCYELTEKGKERCLKLRSQQSA